MFEDSLVSDSKFYESQKTPAMGEENVIGDDYDDAGEGQMMYFELFSDIAHTISYSNPSGLLTAFRNNSHK